MEPEPPLTVEERSVPTLRQQLYRSSLQHQKIADQYMVAWDGVANAKEVNATLNEGELAMGAAMHGHVMAASLAYTLAAALALIEKQYGEDVANDLASQLDTMLTNGDFDDVNADLAARYGASG